MGGVVGCLCRGVRTWGSGGGDVRSGCFGSLRVGGSCGGRCGGCCFEALSCWYCGAVCVADGAAMNCGAGGGRMFMEERIGKRINSERAEELLGTGASAIAVACPFCMTMVTDGVKAAGSEVPVCDISEVVAQRIAVS